MTSSLVGSEMCIRDRGCAMTPQTGLHSRLYRQSSCTGWGFVRSIPTTVSYTHLTLPTICSV
eukprot:7175789-Prorocentrum_lima.AAC.1